jgi:predicted RNase H-like HicB family nuclease
MARKSVKVEAKPVDASARLRMPYTRLLVPEEDGSYRAEILEFPGCIALGESAAEALAELEDVAEDWIDAAMEMGSPIPRPLEETDYSGKLNVRLPKSLHRKASLAADLDGVSLNQLIVTSVAEYLGQKAARPVPPQVMVVGNAMSRVQVVTGVQGAPVSKQGVYFSGHNMATNLGGFELLNAPMQEFQYADR